MFYIELKFHYFISTSPLFTELKFKRPSEHQNNLCRDRFKKPILGYNSGFPNPQRHPCSINF